MSILTSELAHGWSGHSRTVSTEVEFAHVGQYGGLPAVHAAEQAHHCHISTATDDNIQQCKCRSLAMILCNKPE